MVGIVLIEYALKVHFEFFFISAFLLLFFFLRRLAALSELQRFVFRFVVHLILV